MKGKVIPVILTAVITSLATVFAFRQFEDDVPFLQQQIQLPVNYTDLSTTDRVNSRPPADFVEAAQASIQAVVHIKTQTRGKTITARDPFFDNDFFGGLFGQRQYYIPPQVGSGSGVVISPDGYIVTNYHVVSNAAIVTVTFNDRYTTEAKVVAKDASTDIAVLKVKEDNLPYMEFGNSDDVQLGQWVLAVGYPLTLDATVTAGIVSAKSRSLGINRRQSNTAIESFIQTDAAVNPGNSGGALVNSRGQLIGINSAIASPTGSYAGYSYAIPSNIVQKVVHDLIKYGSFQRAYLGVEYLNVRQLSPEQVHELGIDRTDGVYVAGVPESGAAFHAGLRKGDFILEVNGVAVETGTQLLEQVALYRPGDHISITYLRNGKTYKTNVELRNVRGTTAIIRDEAKMRYGVAFRPLNTLEKKQLQVSHGLMITDIEAGPFTAQTNIKKGFVITSINNRAVTTEDEALELLGSSNTVRIAGFYPGQQGIYYYGIDLAK